MTELVLLSHKMVSLLGVGKDVNARIDERADKSYATQVYYCMSIGATRMEEAKVLGIVCQEA